MTMKKLSRKQVIISMSINNVDKIIASVRVTNSGLNFIFNFQFSFDLFSILGYGISVYHDTTYYCYKWLSDKT